MAREIGLTVFETSRKAGSIPIVLVLGEHASDTRCFLNLLFSHRAFADSVLICTQDQALAPMCHPRLIALPRLDSSAQESCLCCGMHGYLGDTLRTLFFDALGDRTKRLDRVVIESEAIETAQLSHTLRHTPFLGQRYFHQMTFRVVRAEQVLTGGIESLVGLDPVNCQSKQFLIAISPAEGVVSESGSGPFSLASFQACAADIERELPYQGAFLLRESHEAEQDSQGPQGRISGAETFFKYFHLN